MPTQIVIKAQLHRPRYVPGDVVKATFTLICTDKITSSDKKKNAGMVTYAEDISRLEERHPSGDRTVAATITRTTAQFVGCRVVDRSRVKASGSSPSTPAEEEGFIQMVTSPESLPAHEEPHCIFTSSVAVPIAQQTMQMHEHVSACVSCTLPYPLPPTYRGQCARFYYGMYINCTYSVGGEVRLCSMRVPIRITSPIAAITTLRAPYATNDQPLEIHSVILPPLPTPAISSPLSDQMLVRELGTKEKDDGAEAEHKQITGGASATQFLVHTLQQTMAEQAAATEYCIRHKQVPTLGLILLSSAIEIGDTVRGVFVTMPNNEYCCARVNVSVESFETVPRDLFQPGSVIPKSSRKDDSGEDLVVTQSKVVDEQEFFLLNAAQLPFEFHITPLKYTQTLKTDVVRHSWCLRFKFWTCLSGEVPSVGGSTAVKLLPDYDELEVPLTIYSPMKVEIPRVGAQCYAAQ